MSQNPFQFTRYANELWDGFDSLSKISSSESNFVKDSLKFFKKRVEIEETYAKSLQKLAQKSQYTLSTYSTLARAWEAVLKCNEAEAAIHNKLANGISSKVCDALSSLLKDIESQRKQIVNDGNKLNDEKSKFEDSLKKSKMDYEKSCKEAEISALTLQQARSDGVTKSNVIQKLEKETDKKKKTSQDCEDNYKKKVVETNNFLEKYYEEKMPKILSEFEHMDMIRNHMVKTNMKKFITVLEDLPDLMSRAIESVTKTVELINSEQDFNEFITKNKTGKEIPDAYEFEAYQQGNQQPKKLKSQKFGRKTLTSSSPSLNRLSVNLPKPINAVFGVPIKEIMAKQKEKHPDLQVPLLLHNLVEAIFVKDGIHTEGIFRIPATASEVQAIKEKVDQGNYDLINQCSEVHTPCALMKLWLREIPEPLIPNEYYETCIENPEKAFEVLMKIPAENQSIITFIIQFLKELIRPEVIQFTKMNSENLAMVFAPNFLRCPYQDYNQVLRAAEKEKTFVLFLLERIPSSVVASEQRARSESNYQPKPPITSSGLFKEEEDELDNLLNLANEKD